ncbi:MAG: 6,7-dimethyl-8-ribityllumazine synthase [Rhodospirillales bacterium]|nr:6,7-dimethyl-8-ribityllumazine synthase [Rhodospirillales bacterium]
MSTADAPEATAFRIEGPPPHLLVVRAPYYREVVDALTAGAERILRGSGATFETLDVAGAFELAQVIRIVLRGPARHDGFIALGCVVRGETDHYEHICREAMGGLMRVALQFGLALGTGLLTVDRLDQAISRARPDGPNKGAEAARAALLQIAAARRFGAEAGRG